MNSEDLNRLHTAAAIRFQLPAFLEELRNLNLHITCIVRTGGIIVRLLRSF